MLGRAATVASLLSLALSWAGAASAAATTEGFAQPVVPRMERVAACSWDRPGHNPFMGDVVASIDRYVDIPTPVRIKLKERMRQHRYDDLVSIRRDSIEGRRSYEPRIRDMHFGWDRVCGQVSRNGWTDAMRERGLVYCESGHCILVPTVCRNVSRINPRPEAVADAREGPGGIDSSAAEAAGGPQEGDPARDGPRVVTTPITSSFAEAVADANVPLWTAPPPPPLNEDGSGLPPLPPWVAEIPGDGAGGPGGGAGGGGVPPGSPGPGDGGPILGGGGDDGGAGGGSGPGGPGDPGGPGAPGDGVPGGGGPGGDWPGGGGGGLPPGGGGGPVSPIPEPATWASLAMGLAALAAVTRRRRQARGTANCMTQNRS